MRSERPGPDRPAAPARRAAALLGALALLVGCRLTVNDYLREAESGAPEAIAEAIEAIGHLLRLKEAQGVPFDAGDDAALEYLRKVARDGEYRMHRAQAIRALAGLEAHDAPQLFRDALGDAFWLVRFNAVQALAARQRPEDVEAIAALLAKETRSEVRLEAVKGIGRFAGDRALRALFEIYLAPRQNDERAQAYFALRRITGLEHGYAERHQWQAAYRERFGDAGAAAAPPATAGARAQGS